MFIVDSILDSLYIRILCCQKKEALFQLNNFKMFIFRMKTFVIIK
jgi:hypothetical protein